MLLLLGLLSCLGKMFSELNPIVLMRVSKNIYLQALYELNETRKWAALHVADNCCFHYRRVSSVNCWMIIKCSIVSKCRKVPMTEFLFFFSAAYAQNFSRIKLRRNKFWSHSRHLSSVEGKFVY